MQEMYTTTFHKKRYLTSTILLYTFLWSLLFFKPIFLGPHYAKYYTFFYPVICLISLFTLKNKQIVNLGRNKLFYTLLFFHIVLMVVYRQDKESLLNLSALIISYFSLYVFSLKCREEMGIQRTEDILFRTIIWISLISIPVSIFLTMLNWGNAPTHFPWEAFTSDKRFLVLAPEGVGHSNIIWLTVFGALYLITKASHRKRLNLFTISYFVLCMVVIIFSKSRAALLFATIIFCYFTVLIGHKLKYILMFATVIITCYYYVISFNPNWSYWVQDSLWTLQENMPELRIVGSQRQKCAIFTGRDILNRVLFDYTRDNVIFGLGDSHPIFKYGVDASGKIAYSGNRGASSESILVILAKYGLIYFLLIWALIVKSVIVTVRSKNSLSMVCMCIIVATLPCGGVFLQLYSLSALFVFMILLYFSLENVKGYRGHSKMYSRLAKQKSMMRSGFF